MKELVRANFSSGYRYLLGVVFTIGVLLALGIGLLLDEPRVRAQDTISPEHNCDVRQLNLLGDRVSATWGLDCLSEFYIGGEGYDIRAHFFYFTVEEPTYVNINLSSTRYNGLVLYNSIWDGDEAVESDEEVFMRNSRINRLLEPGTYYLEAVVSESYLSATDRTTSFAYTLTILGFDNQACVYDIRIGAAEQGTWPRANCGSFLGGGVASSYYRLVATEDVILSASLSATVDVALRVYETDWTRISTSDAPFRSNQATVGAQLSHGNYILEVATDSAGGIGQTFELTLTRFATNLRGAFDPVIAGTEVFSSKGACTLGLVARLEYKDSSQYGLVTNSHCTSIRGQTDATALSQGEIDNKVTRRGGVLYSSDGSVEILFGELADPPLYDSRSKIDTFNDELDKLLCVTYSDNQCQYSDAAFFNLNEAKSADFLIARPENRNRLRPHLFLQQPLNSNSPHLKIDQDRPYFQIVGVDTVEVGDIVHKVGRTTGWTAGHVEQVCTREQVNYDEGTGLLFCQIEFRSIEGYVLSGNGDSGSPVFKCVTPEGDEDFYCSSGLVNLVGILHSGDTTHCFDGGPCVGENAFFNSVHALIREFNKTLETPDLCWVVDSGGECVDLDSTEIAPDCPVAKAELEENIEDSWLEECFTVSESSVANYGLARYYELEAENNMEVWVSVTPDHVANTQVNILNGNNYFTYGENLAQGDNLVERVPLEAGLYLVEVISDTPGNFRLQLSTEELSDPAEVVPTPPETPDVTPPIEPNLPEIIVPEVEQDNSLSGLLIVAAAIAVLLLLVLLPPTIGITWYLVRRRSTDEVPDVAINDSPSIAIWPPEDENES